MSTQIKYEAAKEGLDVEHRDMTDPEQYIAAINRNPLIEAFGIGKNVATLSAGATFGEICLNDPTSQRTATIKVSDDTNGAKFLTINEAIYNKIVKSQQIEASRAIDKFIKTTFL